MTTHEHEHREFTLRGGFADGAVFKIPTCEHGGWPDLALTPKPAETAEGLPVAALHRPADRNRAELLYRFDPAADTYVYIGQSEAFDGD